MAPVERIDFDAAVVDLILKERDDQLVPDDFDQEVGFIGRQNEVLALLLELQAPVSGDDLLDFDRDVDITDLLALLSRWGGQGGLGDIDNDGKIDVMDLLELIEAWGVCD